MARIHSFVVEYAQKYGIEEAIIINCLQWWIERNRAEGRNFEDGHWWTWNTYESWAKLIPYLSARQIERGMDSLVRQEVIIREQRRKTAEDPAQRSNRNWYAFVDEETFLGPEVGEKPTSRNRENPPPEIGRTHLPKSGDMQLGTLTVPESTPPHPPQDSTTKSGGASAKAEGMRMKDSTPGRGAAGNPSDPATWPDDPYERGRRSVHLNLPTLTRIFRCPPTGNAMREIIDYVTEIFRAYKEPPKVWLPSFWADVEADLKGWAYETGYITPAKVCRSIGNVLARWAAANPQKAGL